MIRYVLNLIQWSNACPACGFIPPEKARGCPSGGSGDASWHGEARCHGDDPDFNTTPLVQLVFIVLSYCPRDGGIPIFMIYIYIIHYHFIKPQIILSFLRFGFVSFVCLPEARSAGLQIASSPTRNQVRQRIPVQGLHKGTGLPDSGPEENGF